MHTTIISGNVGKNSELRQTGNGKKVLNFSLANTVGYGDNEKTLWFRCAVWGERAEKLAPHIVKGTKLLLSGEVSASAWLKENEPTASLELFVRELEFIGAKQSGGGESAPGSDGIGGGNDLDDPIPFITRWRYL